MSAAASENAEIAGNFQRLRSGGLSRAKSAQSVIRLREAFFLDGNAFDFVG